ncbi:MAG: hypothetical protein KDA21_11130 [Phycisphaerales bacterium]|nr:hypothetical protein [Phycisphaerales bacterium]
MQRAGLATTFVCLIVTSAQAAPETVVFRGNDLVDDWAMAVGEPVPTEDFESYTGTPDTSPTGDPIMALPALGVTFATDVPGVYPGVYDDDTYAHSGHNNLSNFGAGGARWSDYRILAEPGKAIFALAFWQTDPQGAQPMYLYGADGELVTVVTANPVFSDVAFAGCVTNVPVVRVEVPGGQGDGWNHLDDLSILTRPFALPACPGDVTGNGSVDFEDLNELLEQWNTCVPPGTEGDLNGDIVVDFDDLNILLDHWNSTCP